MERKTRWENGRGNRSKTKARNIHSKCHMQPSIRVVLAGLLVLIYFLFGGSRKQERASIHVTSSDSSAPAPTTASSNVLESVEVQIKRPIDATLAPSPISCDGTPTEEKPWLVWHVGPPKTGSSSIQAALDQFNDRSLVTDNYSYEKWTIQIDAKKRCTTIMSSVLRKPELNRPKSKENTNMCWELYTSRMKSLSARQKNVVMSDEMIAAAARRVKDQNYSFVDRWMEDLSPSFRIAVIVVHRRYFELLHSQYNQKYKTVIDKKEKTEWLDSGGKHLPSYPQYVETAMDALKQGKAIHGSTPDQVLAAFEGKVDLLHVMDFHNGDLLTNFFCNALPHAPETCQRIKVLEVAPPHANAGTSLVDYDRLATAAYAQGRIDGKRYRRSDITSVVRDYQEKVLNSSLIDLPLTCAPMDVMERLFRKSLIMEKEVLGNRSDLQLHQKQFKAFRAAKKHCSIDVLVVLQDPKWQAFFRQYA